MVRMICFCVSFYLMATMCAQNVMVADTFTYTINLDLSNNTYLKTIPIDILKGYCRGDWNAYYPKREMNQCLFDDFLEHYKTYPIQIGNEYACLDLYCSHAYYTDFYTNFTRKLRYKELVYFDVQHQTEKRMVLWLQLYFSRLENDVWKHYPGPIFYMDELSNSTSSIYLKNKGSYADKWTLEKEFHSPSFIINEHPKKTNQKKIQQHYDVQTE